MAAVESGTGAYVVASVFQVSVSYIYKALGRRRTTGETSARPWAGGPSRSSPRTTRPFATA
jgi:transposase